MHERSCEAAKHGVGGMANSCTALAAFEARASTGFPIRPIGLIKRFVTIAVLFAACMTAAPIRAHSQSATPVGTQIRNVATVSYGSAGSTSVVNSNAVVATVSRPASSSSLALLRSSATDSSMKVSATECRTTNGTMTLSQPTQASGQVLDLNQPVALTLASTLHGGEAVFLRLTDADQNLDATAIDYVRVRLSTPSGDREELRLAESGDDTGVFIGFIQTHAGATSVGNCVLDVERNAAIRSEYVDPADARDVSSATALVDPYGLIFNSSTGQAVAGARVRLVNTITGTDADVFGDDGKSRYPAEMITGEAVTDSSGTVYMLPAGVFRFPLVAPGSYKVEVIPPAGHAFPSTQDATQLA